MKKLLTITLVSALLITCAAALFWVRTQAAWPVEGKIEKEKLIGLPGNNKKVLDVIEKKGRSLAPTYEASVCTEFVIKVIEEVRPLTKDERNDVRIIIGTSSLDSLVMVEAPVIKGVQTALLKRSKGIEIKDSHDVLPGDFVQFWNVGHGQAYGHCGIVLDLVPGETLTLYSSHPATGGYGTQQYLWPDQTYFVRLQ